MDNTNYNVYPNRLGSSYPMGTTKHIVQAIDDNFDILKVH